MKPRKLHPDEIMSKLRGRVFHVTSKAGFEGIVSVGNIRCQREELDLPNRYDADEAYGRNRDYVSFLDLRGFSEDTVQEELDKHYFLNPPNVRNEPHFLMMSDDFAETLIPWTQARKESVGELWVPYVESYSPSPVDLAHVVECYCVTFRPSEWEGMLGRRSD